MISISKCGPKLDQEKNNNIEKESMPKIETRKKQIQELKRKA